MTSVPARVAGAMPKQESIVKAFAAPGAIALCSTVLCLCANLACAQATTPAQATASAQAEQPAAPLQLQVPTQPFAAMPAEPSDNAIVDAHDSGVDNGNRGPQLHGSFTTGIGYSKGYGTSTMNAADLDISGQTDSGRIYDVQIHLRQSKGPGFAPYGGYYGPHFRGY